MVKEVPKHTERALFTYSTKHLPNKDKVLFYYALKGRNGKAGIIKLYHIEQLAKTVLFVQKQYEQDVKNFLEFWKCPYQARSVYTKP